MPDQSQAVLETSATIVSALEESDTNGQSFFSNQWVKNVNYPVILLQCYKFYPFPRLCFLLQLRIKNSITGIT